MIGIKNLTTLLWWPLLIRTLNLQKALVEPGAIVASKSSHRTETETEYRMRKHGIREKQEHLIFLTFNLYFLWVLPHSYYTVEKIATVPANLFRH